MWHLVSLIAGMIIGCFIQRNNYADLLDKIEQALIFSIRKSDKPDHINEALMIIDYIRCRATGRKFDPQKWLFKSPLNISPYDLKN